jgi:hypothetical protein
MLLVMLCNSARPEVSQVFEIHRDISHAETTYELPGDDCALVPEPWGYPKSWMVFVDGKSKIFKMDGLRVALF